LSAAAPQGSAAVSGIVTDPANAPLPGVRITVTMGKFERRTVTRSDGRYVVRGLPVGRYNVRAELAGFESASKEDIGVETGAVNEVSFILHAGCLAEVDYVDPGFAATVRRADTAVVRIRILSAHVYERCPAKVYCACTDYEAIVERVLKAPRTDLGSTRISLVHDGTNRYQPAEEYVAFLHWSPMYMFPIRNGRVEVVGRDVPGVSNGMTVDQFADALGRLMLSGKPQ
jgi:carboxypeptidase family protein